ncbi:MAG: hypothetical protein K2H14_05630 [Muribaculaceae bacterium]|nr:hypothetical protein [Muribaculaceae bacterium]
MKKLSAIQTIFKILPVAVLFMVMSVLTASGQTSYEYIAPRTALPDVPPGYTGIGPVVSGSIDYSSLPSKARKFLQKHCDGHALVRCEKEYTSGDYKLSLADGIDMEFDSKGRLIDIEAPESYSLAPMLLKAVVPGKLYNLLDHNGFKSSVEAVHHDSSGYRLDIADPVFSQVCYDPSGVLTLIVDKQ